MSQSDCRSLKRSVQDRLEGIAEGKGYLVGAVQRTLNTAERKGCISRDERDTILSELQDLARTQNTGLVPEIESDIDQAFSDGEIEAPARNPGNPGNPHNNPNDNNNDDEEDFGSLEPQREDPERQRTLEGERAEGETGPQPAESRERARGRRAFEEGQETLGQSGTSRLTEFEEDMAPNEIVGWTKVRETESEIVWGADFANVPGETRGGREDVEVRVTKVANGYEIRVVWRDDESGEEVSQMVEEGFRDDKPRAIDAAQLYMEDNPAIPDDVEPRSSANFGGLLLDARYGVDDEMRGVFENDLRRARAERLIEQLLAKKLPFRLDESRVNLRPAGFLVGVGVDIAEDEVSQENLEDLIGVLDEGMKKFAHATRERGRDVAPDRPEWEIRCR